MNSFGNALLIAMPIFYALILIEIAWGYFMKNEKPNMVDSISSLFSGMSHILKSTLGLTIIVITYPWMLENVSLMQWTASSVWPYIITFVFLDFIGYWIHRLNHSINLFWNFHVIHHSSEEFNLPCALRQSLSEVVNIFTISLIPLAMIGIPEAVLVIVGPVHFFTQFWYHTRYIGKLGFLEHILVTPSHHRVHHAMNDKYLDTNFSQIFIVWDKWFGTFQEELDSEPCVYGVRRPAGTWNPFIINFKHWWSLAQDAWRTENVADKFKIWFKPTGWRPADVERKYPLFTISKMSELKKYAPTYSKAFSALSFLHANVIFLLICFLFLRLGEIAKTDALNYGLLLLASVFSFTALLDKKAYGLISTIVVSVLVAGLCVVQGDWFGLNSFFPLGSTLVASYSVLSTVVFVLFYWKELALPEQTVTLTDMELQGSAFQAQ